MAGAKGVLKREELDESAICDRNPLKYEDSDEDNEQEENKEKTKVSEQDILRELNKRKKKTVKGESKTHAAKNVSKIPGLKPKKSSNT